MLLFYLSLLDTEEEKEKFRTIYEQYHRPMLQYALKILRHQEDAEDAVQTTFEKLIKILETIQEPVSSDTKTLIMVILRNTCRDLWRQKKYRFAESLDQISPGELSSGVNYFENLEVQQLYDAIGKLSAKEQELLLLKWYHDLSNDHIAKILNISYTNASKRIERTRAKLKTILEEEQLTYEPRH